MKRYLFPLFLVVAVLVTFLSCSNKAQRSRKPVSTIDLNPSEKNYILGKSLLVEVNTKLRDGELKQVQLYLNGKLLKTGNEQNFTYQIGSLENLGSNTLKVYAEKADGVSNSRTQNFLVVSDVVPEKMGYQIVKEYPHSTEHFTQGLELHDGFLYEGTGENGKSAIYRKNLSTGNIMLQQPLDKQYFGEGITILNDKIYQLTYKTQKGFVYRLSDFAVIDSFRYDSKEGWGLTNDGKSLIMSDGTGTLTWLDPQTYQPQKTVTVADHEKVLQYLNELEYVDGSIYANIWTTNNIVKIDAQTGKVLAVIDLSGILSVMFKNGSQQIDVLNGIAYNAQTGRFLVTGKLWPKMFEIEFVPSK